MIEGVFCLRSALYVGIPQATKELNPCSILIIEPNKENIVQWHHSVDRSYDYISLKTYIICTNYGTVLLTVLLVVRYRIVCRNQSSQVQLLKEIKEFLPVCRNCAGGNVGRLAERIGKQGWKVSEVEEENEDTDNHNVIL
jgi:hypothetical protein